MDRTKPTCSSCGRRTKGHVGRVGVDCTQDRQGEFENSPPSRVSSCPDLSMLSDGDPVQPFIAAAHNCAASAMGATPTENSTTLMLQELATGIKKLTTLTEMLSARVRHLEESADVSVL